MSQQSSAVSSELPTVSRIPSQPASPAVSLTRGSIGRLTGVGLQLMSPEAQQERFRVIRLPSQAPSTSGLPTYSQVPSRSISQSPEHSERVPEVGEATVIAPTSIALPTTPPQDDVSVHSVPPTAPSTSRTTNIHGLTGIGTLMERFSQLQVTRHSPAPVVQSAPVSRQTSEHGSSQESQTSDLIELQSPISLVIHSPELPVQATEMVPIVPPDNGHRDHIIPVEHVPETGEIGHILSLDPNTRQVVQWEPETRSPDKVRRAYAVQETQQGNVSDASVNSYATQTETRTRTRSSRHRRPVTPERQSWEDRLRDQTAGPSATSTAYVPRRRDPDFGYSGMAPHSFTQVGNSTMQHGTLPVPVFSPDPIPVAGPSASYPVRHGPVSPVVQNFERMARTEAAEPVTRRRPRASAIHAPDHVRRMAQAGTGMAGLMAEGSGLPHSAPPPAERSRIGEELRRSVDPTASVALPPDVPAYVTPTPSPSLHEAPPHQSHSGSAPPPPRPPRGWHNGSSDDPGDNDGDPTDPGSRSTSNRTGDRHGPPPFDPPPPGYGYPDPGNGPNQPPRNPAPRRPVPGGFGPGGPGGPGVPGGPGGPGGPG
ncbi:hypothetical protein FRC09_017677, partial [Ceratobasidium sp. 395]